MSRTFQDNEYYLYTPGKKVNYDVNRVICKIIKPKGWLERKLPSVWRTLWLKGPMRKHRLDIYHGLSNELPLRMPRKTRKVVTIHDVIFMRYPELYNFIDRKIYKYKFTQACRNAHKILAISEQTRQDIIHYLKADPAKIEVLYQDCDSTFREVCSPQTLEEVKHRHGIKYPYILSVGTIEERKNQINILKAFARLEEFEDVKLVFIGKHTDYVRRLHDYIKSKGMENRVVFFHRCNQEDLPALYQGALLTVYISVFEGFGLPVLESMCSRVPVIASNSSSIKEIAGEAAELVDPENPDEIAAAIKKLLSDKAYASSLAEKGIINAEKFKAQQIGDRLLAIYRELLGNRGASDKKKSKSRHD